MITKIVVDANETCCLVMTARSEFLFLNLIKNEAEEDVSLFQTIQLVMVFQERFEKLKFIDVVPSCFELHVTKSGNPMAVMIISGYPCYIRLIDLKTKEDVKPAISLRNLIRPGSIISSISKIVNDMIVLSESNGKFCIVDRLNEVSFLSQFP